MADLKWERSAPDDNASSGALFRFDGRLGKSEDRAQYEMEPFFGALAGIAPCSLEH
jgi:hypothetical protein